MSTATLDGFIREIPDKLEAILKREIVKASCGEYTIERTMSGIMMSSAFARVVLERLRTEAYDFPIVSDNASRRNDQ